MNWLKRHKKLSITTGVLLLLFVVFLCIPVPHFDNTYSTVITAADGQLLGARVAADGQWRFPATNTYSKKYVTCLLEYEDQQFYHHIGFNPVAFVKAFIANRKAGHIVRGGSTITMQVVRLARDDRERTYWEKLVEVVLAVRMELHYSKNEILDLYAAHAPFGGNVVGIDAAAWRYFHTTPDRLTWSEAATLAVLPNSPALIHPGRSREQLYAKRNALLQRLGNPEARIPNRKQLPKPDEDDIDLAIDEDLPQQPYDMPMDAYHYLVKMEKEKPGQWCQTTIDYTLQRAVTDILNRHYSNNSLNHIENAAVYVLDYLDNEIKAYIGNNMCAKNAAMVDMVQAQRSTGSTLKPFLFAAMLDDGSLMPDMIVPDIPYTISGFTPRNYSGQYLGAVPASKALQYSLNTPFVILLRDYGVPRFLNLLKSLKLSGLVFDSDHYGLSLILGGGEASLFDITNAYGQMGRRLASALNEDFDGDGEVPFSTTAVWQTLNVMTGLTRPESEIGWGGFSSSKRVAWKTGTSFGFKDAWAIGLTDRYVVGVWVGNSDGEGRPGLTGTSVAAPIMFEVVGKLQGSFTYTEVPADAVEVEVCAESGYPCSEVCPRKMKAYLPDVENKTGVCPYHKKIYLDKSRQYRVQPDCYDIDQKCYDVYLILPPVMEWFYKQHSPLYRPLPAFYPGCGNSAGDDVMSFIYPKDDARVTIPIGIKGDRQQVVFEIAHRNPQKTVYWSIGNKFLGETKRNHQMPIDVEKGTYDLRCVDEDGVELRRRIVVN